MIPDTVVYLYEIIPYIRRLKTYKQDRCLKMIAKTINEIEYDIKNKESEKQGEYGSQLEITDEVRELDDELGGSDEDEVFPVHDVPCDAQAEDSE